MFDLLTGSVSIESGTLGVGDSSSFIHNGFNPDSLLQHIKEGKAVCVGTGGDGIFGIIIRETKDLFDLLPEEGEKISSLSSPLLINVSSGNLTVSDMSVLGESSKDMNKIEHVIHPAVYECMIHMCDNESAEFFGFVIVLKKTNLEEAKNENVREIEQLG